MRVNSLEEIEQARRRLDEAERSFRAQMEEALEKFSADTRRTRAELDEAERILRDDPDGAAALSSFNRDGDSEPWRRQMNAGAFEEARRELDKAERFCRAQMEEGRRQIEAGMANARREMEQAEREIGVEMEKARAELAEAERARRGDPDEGEKSD